MTVVEPSWDLLWSQQTSALPHMSSLLLGGSVLDSTILFQFIDLALSPVVAATGSTTSFPRATYAIPILGRLPIGDQRYLGSEGTSEWVG